MRTLFLGKSRIVVALTALLIAITLSTPTQAAALAAQLAATGPLTVPQNPPQDTNASAGSVITVPAGTKAQIALTAPVMARTAKAGDSIYGVVSFPVTVNNQTAIPAGTYAQGIIDGMTRPTLFSPHADFQIHFTKLVFANGYAVALPPGTATTDGTAIAMAYVNVRVVNDVLLDNGSPLEMELRSALALDASSVAKAIRASRQVQTSQFKSATRCRPTAGTSGTPGTPDTVIPGTPATPDVVIPGAPGMPDTVIPGSPGTPATVIPGTPGMPGSPGTACPGPPVVSSTPGESDAHKESFKVSGATAIGGTTLAAGSYQVSWLGLGPSTPVDILKGKEVVAHAQAQVVMLDAKAKKSDTGIRTNAGGGTAIASLQFKGKTYMLNFGGG